MHLGFPLLVAIGIASLAAQPTRLRATESPLPSVEQILKRALERGELEWENDAKFKQQYFFVRRRTTEIRNAEGELKKLKNRISTNAPVVGQSMPEPETSTLPLKGIGSPVPAATSAQAIPRKFDKNEFQFSADLIARYDFKLVGRETTNGGSTLVLDFVPKKKKLPENGIRDRVVNRVAGRVWVDEREFAIKKAALHLTESINIIGGIVGAAHKFEYQFDRERTEDGLWYVTNSEWHLEGREVLVQRKADFHETRTQVHKVESPGRTQR